MTLEQYNRSQAAYVQLRRNTELERRIILERPVQRYPGRRTSLHIPPVGHLPQPIIQTINQNPVEQIRPPTRTRRQSFIHTRPSVESFVRQVNQVEQQNQVQQQSTMRPSSFYSRGRRPLSTPVQVSYTKYNVEMIYIFLVVYSDWNFFIKRAKSF